MAITTFPRPFESVSSIGDFGDSNAEQTNRSDREKAQPSESEAPTKPGRLASLRTTAANIVVAIKSRTQSKTLETVNIVTLEQAVKDYMEAKSAFFELHPQLAQVIENMNAIEADSVCAEADTLIHVFTMNDFTVQSRREEMERGTLAVHIAQRLLKNPNLTAIGARDISNAVALAGRGNTFNYRPNEDYPKKDSRKFASDKATRESLAEIDVFTHMALVETRISENGLENDMEFLVDTHRLHALAQGMEALAIAVTEEIPNESLSTQTIDAMKKLQTESVSLAIALHETYKRATSWHEEMAQRIVEAKARRILNAELNEHKEELVEAILSMPPLQQGSIEEQPNLITDYVRVSDALARYAERMDIKLHPELIDELGEVMKSQPAVALGIFQLAATLNGHIEKLKEQGKTSGLTKEQVYELMGALFASAMKSKEGARETGKYPDLELLNGLRALNLAERVTVTGERENPLLVLHPESGDEEIEMYSSDRDPAQIEAARRACAEYVVNRLQRMTYPGTITSRAGVFNLNPKPVATLSGIDLANVNNGAIAISIEPESIQDYETVS